MYVYVSVACLGRQERGVLRRRPTEPSSPSGGSSGAGPAMAAAVDAAPPSLSRRSPVGVWLGFSLPPSPSEWHTTATVTPYSRVTVPRPPPLSVCVTEPPTVSELSLTVSLWCRQEGPHSTIGEDEFFDAVESALDRITEDQEFRDKMRKKQSVKPSEAPKSSQHSLLQEVCNVYVSMSRPYNPPL